MRHEIDIWINKFEKQFRQWQTRQDAKSFG